MKSEARIRYSGILSYISLGIVHGVERESSGNLHASNVLRVLYSNHAIVRLNIYYPAERILIKIKITFNSMSECVVAS